MKKVLGPKSLTATFVAVLTFVIFTPALENEFVNWDDDQYIYDNSFIRSLDIKSVKSVFSGFYAGNWHPLTWMSHALDYSLWGLNPFGHHLTNVVLHAINTLLVVLLVMRLVEIYRKNAQIDVTPNSFINGRTTLIIGTITGLLFGVHPLHVESVAWVSERKDLLCALFFLLSLSSYTIYANKSNEPIAGNSKRLRFNRQYFFSLVFFVLALMSKPMAVSLPFVLLILDWYPFRRARSIKTFWTAFVEKLPFLGLSLVSVVLTILAQGATRSIAPIDDITISTRVMVASNSLIIYLWKMVVPQNLSPFYPYPHNVTILSPEYLCSSVCTVAITGICIFLVKRHKLLLTVWGCYVITLLPVLGIIQVGEQSMADRYTYLPSMGPFLLIALLFAWSYRAVNSLKWKIASRLFAGVIAACLFFTMMYLTLEQISKWKSSISLWSCVIENEPGAVPQAYYSRGYAFYEKGLLDNALADYNTAIALNPFSYESYNNRGIILEKKGRYEEAIEDFGTVIRLMPSNYHAYYNRARLFRNLGMYDRAAEDSDKAAELNR